MKKITYLLFIVSSIICGQSEEIAYANIFQLGELSHINEDSVLTVSINKNLPDFIFKMKFDSIHNIDNYGSENYTYYKVKIYNSINSNLIQEIIDTLEIPIEWAGIVIFDINLDNYLDIYFTKHMDIRGNFSYNYWLFDSLAKKFNYSEEFSDHFYSGTVIDELNKTFTNSSYSWAVDESYSTKYKITNNIPIVIKRSSESWNDNGAKMRTLVEELIDGVMTVTKDSIYVK